MSTGSNSRMVRLLSVCLTITILAGCSPSLSPRQVAAEQEQRVTDLALKTQLPIPTNDLKGRCSDPGLTDDKGQDALNHRAALASCARKVINWQAFYADVYQRYSAGAQ